MRVATIAAIVALLGVGQPSTASSQPRASAGSGPVALAAIGVHVTRMEDHEKFWLLLGGKQSKNLIDFPGTARSFRVALLAQKPTGGTKGTTVNHIAFAVPNVRQVVEKARAAGYPIVTKAEQRSPDVKDDIASITEEDTVVAFVMGPDDVKVELVEQRGLALPITFHHMHFASRRSEDVKAWYVKMLGAKPGISKDGLMRAAPVADLPGGGLTFGPSSEVVVGTAGRVIDHIAFEVHGLEAFCRKLAGMGIKFDRPYAKRSAIGVALLTDPVGTIIELIEGVDTLGTD